MKVAEVLLDLAEEVSNNKISLEEACTQVHQPEISSSVNFEAIRSLLKQTRRHQFDLVYLGYCLSCIVLEAAKIVGDKRLELECLNSLFTYSLLVGNTSSAGTLVDQIEKIIHRLSSHELDATFLSLKGDLHASQGYYQHALQSYNKALAFYRTGEVEKRECEILERVGFCLHMLGQHRRAVSSLEWALSIARKLNDRDQEASIFCQIASAQLAMGDYRWAEDLLYDAMNVTGSRRLQATAKCTLGRIFMEVGQTKEANSRIHEAVAISHKIGNTVELAMQKGFLGQLYMMYGQLDESLVHILDALKSSQEIGNKHLQTYWFLQMGRNKFYGGLYDEAEVYYTRANSLATEIDNTDLQMQTLARLSELYIEKGEGNEYRWRKDVRNEYVTALKYGRKALESAKRSGNSIFAGSLWGKLGAIHLKLGQTARAVDHCFQGLVISRQAENVVDEVTILRDLGVAWGRLADQERAIDYLEQSAEVAERIEDRYSEALARGELGIYFAHSKRDDTKAMFQFEKAVRLFESVRLEIWEGERRVIFWNRYQLLYQQIVFTSLRLGHLDSALSYCERARSRTFIEELSKTGLRTLPGVPTELRLKIEHLLIHIREIRASAAETRDEHAKTRLLSEAANAERELSILLDRIVEIDPMHGGEYKSLLEGEPLTFQGIRILLF